MLSKSLLWCWRGARCFFLCLEKAASERPFFRFARLGWFDEVGSVGLTDIDLRGVALVLNFGCRNSEIRLV